MAYPYQSYQAPYQYYPVYQQPVAQPTQLPQTQMSNPQNGIIWISGESEAAMYPIAPNNAVVLWAKDGKTIYLKSADATGKPTMRVYDLVERSRIDSDGTSSADSKVPTYATKDDLKAIAGVVRGFDDAIATLKSEIEKISGDLYGIAGKKKTTRKQEAEDE